ncbi:type II toxin-antitoxin system PemK/MazF family toxin [Nitrospira moscoviensis]|uniref:type II toxin-antitoxin system PemK/MazF family toxin n=1 Tax=Nitrospira moscoviensis TaxID=42253 RepID=UPI001930E66D|nr:type II toxin-antitoxin system PemK/MazF family toxin [Nitrospira moscoviensis]
MAEVRKTPRRGDVYWVVLDPTIGSEIKKTRPAVVVSNNSCNTYGSRVVVLPLTSHVDSLYPGEALITVDGKAARALGDQIRSVDKSRLRSRIETLSPDELMAVEDAIRVTLGLRP